jgi:HrpA-like RNA helicase
VSVRFGLLFSQPGTQVPQFLLDAAEDDAGGDSQPAMNIVCTQPRRIAAIGV